MAKYVSIENCGQCPNMEFDYQEDMEAWGIYVCFGPRCEWFEDGAWKELPFGDTHPIPDWCPLPDAPKE